jgi:hypothetical protein
MYILSGDSHCKIDIHINLLILSYKTIYLFIKYKPITIISARMFLGNNNYNYNYNHYHNRNIRVNLNKCNNRYILNEDQDMDEDYGFFVILDSDNTIIHNKPTIKYRETQTQIQKYNETNIVPTMNWVDALVRTPSYTRFVEKYAIIPVIRICGVVCNAFKWLSSYSEME